MTDPVSFSERRPEDIPEFDHARAEAAVRELLAAIGEDPEREGLRETPARVARAYAELTQGIRQTAREVLTTTFDIGHEEMVLVRDIELWSMCEHHLVPFTGVAHVGYIPSENASARVVGLDSMMPRTAEVMVRAPAFFTPRIVMHRCSASITTMTPRASRMSTSASATWVVSRSCTWGRLA